MRFIQTGIFNGIPQHSDYFDKDQIQKADFGEHFSMETPPPAVGIDEGDGFVRPFTSKYLDKKYDKLVVTTMRKMGMVYNNQPPSLQDKAYFIHDYSDVLDELVYKLTKPKEQENISFF